MPAKMRSADPSRGTFAGAARRWELHPLRDVTIGHAHASGR
jgi:hypothetical protein